jgi:hypothetical protein
VRTGTLKGWWRIGFRQGEHTRLWGIHLTEEMPYKRNTSRAACSAACDKVRQPPKLEPSPTFSHHVRWAEHEVSTTFADIRIHTTREAAVRIFGGNTSCISLEVTASPCASAERGLDRDEEERADEEQGGDGVRSGNMPGRGWGEEWENGSAESTQVPART